MTWDPGILITAGASVLVAIIAGAFGALTGVANGRREDERREAEREDKQIESTLNAIENHRAWADSNFQKMKAEIEGLRSQVRDAEGKAERLEGANSALARYIHVILDWVESVVPDYRPPQPPDEIREYIRP